MHTPKAENVAPRMTLQAETASDVMTANPISIRADATLREAIVRLTDRGFTGAPVIDEAGRVVGVVSQTDFLLSQRERCEVVIASCEDDAISDKPSLILRILSEQGGIEDADRRTVAEIMSPGVIAVAPETPISRVVAELVTRRIHRVFVLDPEGIIIGTITPLDILSHMRLD